MRPTSKTECADVGVLSCTVGSAPSLVSGVGFCPSTICEKPSSHGVATPAMLVHTVRVNPSLARGGRELERSFPLEEKQRELEHSEGSPEINKQDPVRPTKEMMSSGYNPVSTAASNFYSRSLNLLGKEDKRSLIDDLADSYGFKEDGLVNKNYVMYSKFTTPTKDARF
ncbi:hypothetical protein DL95DRAFT_471818 [Leptodontidium sp. 2 PMI_412]|nr:hypothetical protein DL95DRAFT_471818 [Leptodontidium sp. 2 PMI_412]